MAVALCAVCCGHVLLQHCDLVKPVPCVLAYPSGAPRLPVFCSVLVILAMSHHLSIYPVCGMFTQTNSTARAAAYCVPMCQNPMFVLPPVILLPINYRHWGILYVAPGLWLFFCVVFFRALAATGQGRFCVSVLRDAKVGVPGVSI